jgi:glycosyltransferase involved in cell wall biosynthesis
MNPSQGGPPSAVAGLAAAQASIGHDVKIFFLESYDEREVLQQSLLNIPGFDKVTLVSCLKRGVFDEITCFSSKKHLESVIYDANIVHIHGMWRPILRAAAKIAKKYRLKYVVAPHGMLTPWSLNQKPIKKKLAMILAWREVLREAAFVQMLSADESSLSLEKGIKTIEIIPNGIFPNNVEDLPQKGSFYGTYSKLKNRPFILFMGRLHHVKGIDILINAFDFVTKANDLVDLVIIGPDGGQKGVLIEQSRRLKLDHRIHFTGPLYGQAKYSALVNALCLCQTSRQEGFSMTIMEAMSVGIPVVISKTCHFPEVAEARAGEIVDLDPLAISSALLRLINDDKLRQSKGQAAKNLVNKYFTWPTIATKSIEAYERIM